MIHSNIKLVLTLAIVTVTIVVGTYSYKFGFGMWSDHTKWSEFGSFFGGVLGPTLAFYSLLYLAIQIEMQRKENHEARISAEIKHQEDYIH